MKGKKLLAALLAVIMVVALVPTMSFAADTTEYFDVSGSGIALSKDAKLEDNGTYTITLQAVSTGEDTVVVSNRPADIVLVLDVSGSMADSIGSYSYTARNSQGYSYSSFGWNASYYIKDGDEYYKVNTGNDSWSGPYYLYYTKNNTTYYLSGTSTTTTKTTVNNWQNTIWTGVLYTQTETSKIAALKSAATAFVNSVAEKNAANKTDSTVALVKFAGTKSNTVGNNTYGNYSYNNTQIVSNPTVMNSTSAASLNSTINSLTAAGATSADYAMEHAQTIINNLVAPETYDKDGRDRVIIFFTDGEPNHQNNFDGTVASAAIKAAKTAKDQGVLIYTIGCFGGTASNNVTNYMNRLSSNSLDATTYQNGTVDTTKGFYKTVSSAEELASIFHSISQTIGGTSVEYTSEAVVKDIISNEFSLPEGFTGGNVDVKVYHCTYENGKYVKGAVDSEKTNDAKKTAAVSGKTISVSGFDYADNFVTASHPGYGLEIIIKGVTANDSILLQDGAVYTNGAASGLYENKDATETNYSFYRPTAAVTRQTVVLDYSKTVSIDVSEEPIYQNVDTTSLFKSFGPVDPKNPLTSIDGTNGTIGLNGKTLTYTLDTMQLSGYDTARLLGKTNEQTVLDAASTSQKTLNIWSYVSFVPANNVYFEDTFVSTTNGDTVGITYSDGWNQGTASAGTISAGDMGDWITTGVNTDGTEATANKVFATATFTFNGTGFDIYGKTSGTNGIVRCIVKQQDKDNNWVIIAVKYIDTKSSDTYYDVPAIFWTAGEYGTYQVELKVCKDPKDATRLDYCIDGIRIYSPIQDDESDAVVKQAYGEFAGAEFVTARDILIETIGSAAANDTVLQGAVFIDPTQGKDWKEINPVMVPKQVVNEDGSLKVDAEGNPVYEQELNEDGTPKVDAEGKPVYVQVQLVIDGVPQYESREISGAMSSIADYTNYGPKNEIYLQAGQMIGMKVNAPYVYIGLRNVNASGDISVKYSNGTTDAGNTVSTSVDKYYKMVPNNGYIFIQNTSAEGSTEILSITKIMTFAGVATQSLADTFPETNLDDMSTGLNAFLAAPVVAAETEAVEAPEEPGITDLTIVNPAAEETADNGVSAWIGDLFSGVRSIFG